MYHLEVAEESVTNLLSWYDYQLTIGQPSAVFPSYFYLQSWCWDWGGNLVGPYPVAFYWTTTTHATTFEKNSTTLGFCYLSRYWSLFARLVLKWVCVNINVTKMFSNSCMTGLVTVVTGRISLRFFSVACF